MTKKILVTGGCGFIGSHIVDKLLKENHEVAIVDNLSTGSLENIPYCNDIRLYKCDIVDDKIQKVISDFNPECIIHQAAQTNVTDSIDNIKHDTEINIKGSINIIDAALRSCVNKVIFASSAAVYGEPNFLPIIEEHVLNPLSPYGLSKKTVENYLKLAKTLYGLDYTILRYSNVYGPRQKKGANGGVISIFLDKIQSNMPVVLYGDGEQTRDFIYVEDVALANVNAIQLANDSVLNISSSKGVSINQLLNIIRTSSDYQFKIVRKEPRKGEIEKSHLSNKLAIKELDWFPKVKLDEGIKLTFSDL